MFCESDSAPNINYQCEREISILSDQTGGEECDQNCISVPVTAAGRYIYRLISCPVMPQPHSLTRITKFLPTRWVIYSLITLRLLLFWSADSEMADIE